MKRPPIKKICPICKHEFVSKYFRNHKRYAIYCSRKCSDAKECPSSKKTIKKAKATLDKKRAENPEKFKKISINNLPKEVSGKRNGNWRGGLTEQNYNWRTNNLAKLNKWRKQIMDRDGWKCRSCGSTKNLEAHHIIPLSESHETAFLTMNGVTLCQKCHSKTDSYKGKGRKQKNTVIGIGITKFIMRVIPPEFAEYWTVGNYKITDSGMIVIFISDQGNDDANTLIFLHELIEVVLTQKRGIKEQDITNFDLQWEQDNAAGKTIALEAGDEPGCCYGKEHRFSENIERLMCAELGMAWDEYETIVTDNWNKMPQNPNHGQGPKE